MPRHFQQRAIQSQEPTPEAPKEPESPILPHFELLDEDDKASIIENALLSTEAMVFNAYLNLIANRRARQEAQVGFRQQFHIAVRNLEDLRKEFRRPPKLSKWLEDAD